MDELAQLLFPYGDHKNMIAFYMFCRFSLSKQSVFQIILFVVMLYVPVNNFSVMSRCMVSCIPWLNQYLAADKVSCSRTTHRDSFEARTQSFDPQSTSLSSEPMPFAFPPNYLELKVAA